MLEDASAVGGHVGCITNGCGCLPGDGVCRHDHRERELLGAYSRGIRPMLLEPAWQGVPDPIERVFALLDRYRSLLTDSDCTYGCPIGSLALELHEPDPPVREASVYFFFPTKQEVLLAVARIRLGGPRDVGDGRRVIALRAEEAERRRTSWRSGGLTGACALSTTRPSAGIPYELEVMAGCRALMALGLMIGVQGAGNPEVRPGFPGCAVLVNGRRARNKI